MPDNPAAPWEVDPLTDILDLLHARCAEISAEAILRGEDHPTVTLTTREVADLLNRITELRRHHTDLVHAHRDLTARHSLINQTVQDATTALTRITTTLEQRTAHPEARTRQVHTIARVAAERLAAAHPHGDDAVR
ncbi:hypothetical protein IU474_19015 [Nocardia otitidiscaviarum]|uniref:hypothetical protein n=1 Tax=Nocardia otitidiscaviarum TaxID=1823 RepID=UPI0018945AA9|nr:hypothetical protein [Nocardia otitidiscaviarum]MBF6239144.1 hypothetical protein [Nocardia otitidiscaviarum]